MTLRKWTALIIVAYVMLAVGAVVTAYRFDQQADDIKDTNRRLVGAAVAYCQAGIAPDNKETAVIDALSRGKTYKQSELDPICRRIAARLEGNIHDQDK